MATTKPVIKPTRRELLDMAINDYAKKLREQALVLDRKGYAAENDARTVEKKKEARLHAHARIPHAETIEKLRKAIEPFGGRIHEEVRPLGVHGITHFYYSGTVEVREEIKEGPNMDDLDQEVMAKMAEARRLHEEANHLKKLAGRFDNQDLFRTIAESLPAEAGEMLDKLAVMIGEALGDKEELVVVVHNLTTNTVEERCPCHSRIQAEKLQRDLSDRYEEGFQVEIEKPGETPLKE